MERSVKWVRGSEADRAIRRGVACAATYRPVPALGGARGFSKATESIRDFVESAFHQIESRADSNLKYLNVPPFGIGHARPVRVSMKRADVVSIVIGFRSLS